MSFSVRDVTITPTNIHPTCTHPLFNANKLYDTKIDPNLRSVTTDSILLYDGAVWTYDNASSFFSSKDYGSFCSLETQRMTRYNLPVPMTYNFTEFSKGISIINYGGVNNSGIKVQTAGLYNIQFSTQINKYNGSGTETVYIWFAKNGSFLPRTNSSIVSANTNVKSRVIPAWNIFLELEKDDVVQIYWVSDDIHIELLYMDQQNITTNTDPPIITTTIPSIPSVILTVSQL
jgi:hypothetical protein